MPFYYVNVITKLQTIRKKGTKKDEEDFETEISATKKIKRDQSQKLVGVFHANNLVSLKMKNGMSATPLN